MPKNSLALPKRRFIFIAVFFFAAEFFLPAQEPATDNGEARWYFSNSSGMTLGETPSRMAALRSEYCVSVRGARYAELPERLLSYYDASFSIELRTLYNRGSEIRRQWILRDRWGLVRVNASGSGAIFTARNSAGETENNSSGFIELRNGEGNTTTEFQFDEDLSEWEYRYFYRGEILIRTEIWFKEAPAIPAAPPEPEPEEEAPPEEDSPEDETGAEENQPPPVPAEETKAEPVLARLYTDYYRYTRSGSLRAIDRTLHGGAPEKSRVGFPRLGPGVSLGEQSVSQGGAYTSEFFVGEQSQTHEEDTKVTYNLDNRGRILGEVWKDDSGAVIGELTNTWSGERLQSVLWKTPDDERLIEYEYDREGNRTVERNFRRGELERSVTIQGDSEIEEIYMNGRVMLRAYWENGIKVSEERVPSTGRRNR